MVKRTGALEVRLDVLLLSGERLQRLEVMLSLHSRDGHLRAGESDLCQALLREQWTGSLHLHQLKSIELSSVELK